MSEDHPATRIAPFGLRMPPDLKARVQALADANNRSMNAEIVARLEESLQDQSREAALFQRILESDAKQERLPGEIADAAERLMDIERKITAFIDTVPDLLEQALAKRQNQKQSDRW